MALMIAKAILLLTQKKRTKDSKPKG